jgi:DNA-binding beta-propeller fold protein YncE
MRRCAITLLCSLLISAGLGASGCNLDNPGDDPPKGMIYLPSGLLLSAADPDVAPRYLYVVNSNFDLRYNSGSLQAFDLERLDREIADCDISGPECEIDTEAVLKDEVLVPSLASYTAPSSGFTRMYVATRTETNLTFVDVREDDDNVLSCKDTDRRCAESYTRYSDPLESARRLELPREAVGIVAGQAQDLLPSADPPLSGEFVLVAHRGGEVSLFLDDLGTADLQLQDVLTLKRGGSSEPLQEPTGITFDPTTHLAYVSIFARDSNDIGAKKVVGRVGLSSATDEKYPAFLYDADALSLEGVSLGRDTRAVTPNPATPGEALIISRTPSALLWVDIASALDGQSLPTQAIVRRTTSVGRGPSRVITGKLGDRTLAIVSCFDARQIFILDAVTSEVLSIVHNFSGPFELGLDAPRKRLYVADFRSSVVRVLDLTPLLEGATETMPTARIVATLGHPQLVQELQ